MAAAHNSWMAGNCMVHVCSRATKMTKVTFKQGQLDKARKQPDPRQKAPELQKAIQSCSRDILKMVRFPALPWAGAPPCTKRNLQM